MAETDKIKALHDNLVPFHEGGEQVYMFNATDGFRYLTVAQAGEVGDAGGDRMTSSTPVRLWPGLSRVAKSYADRVKGDAERQRERGGGVTAQMFDRGELEFVRDLDKTKADKVAGWLMESANIELVAELRAHPKHGEAATRAFEAWNSRESSEATKRLRHFWAMSTGSRKVA